MMRIDFSSANMYVVIEMYTHLSSPRNEHPEWYSRLIWTQNRIIIMHLLVVRYEGHAKRL